MGKGTSRQDTRERRRWLTSLILALLLHVVVLAGIGWMRPLDPTEVRASDFEPIDLVFEPASVPAPAPQKDEPTFFSELPPDRADLPPEHADFLSNVDSRARDTREGGEDGGLPQLRGESDAPHVSMLPEPATPDPQDPGRGEALQKQPEQPGPPSNETSTDPQLQPPSQDTSDTAEPHPGASLTGKRPDTAPSKNSTPPAQASPQVGDPREELLREGSAPNDALILLRRSGQSDVFQEEMNNRDGNVARFGDVSLNTVAWEYAPWLQRFIRDFRRNWVPPYAYYLGLIHGYDTVELEIAPDGSLLRMDLLEEEGHESLAQASMAALRATAPFQRLPADFPEETLILRIKLVYPRPRG